MSRILLEASAAFDQGAGIGRYSRNLLDRLVPALPEHQFTLFRAPARPRPGTWYWSPPNGARIVSYPLSRKRFEHLQHRLNIPLPIRPLTRRQDLMYSPDFSGPWLRGTERIVTFHDLAFLTHPHLIMPGMVAYLTGLVEREVRAGSRIVTVSTTTRRRVVEYLGVSPDQITMVPNGVEPRFFQDMPVSIDELEALGLPADYLLMVGTIEPRKNHEAILRCMTRRLKPGLPIALVGRRGWGTDHLLPEIEKRRTSGDLIWLEGLDDSLLPLIYAGARGVIYPSWTEGFGLPVLEALAAGKPVVTGNDPVFDELAGDLVMKVDPADDDALLEAIRSLEEPPVSSRGQAARRRRAAQYSWDGAVRSLVEMLASVTRQ